MQALHDAVMFMLLCFLGIVFFIVLIGIFIDYK
jgi:hypothetical protein